MSTLQVKEPIRILLAEDHTLVRAGICALLNDLGGMAVVGETGEGYETLRLIREVQPDIVLLDIQLPGLNGLDVASKVTGELPEVRIIIFTMHRNEEYVLQALRAGVSGYLLKDAGTEELELAIRAVMKGGIYLSPAVSRQVVTNYVIRLDGGKGGERSNSGAFELLTPRQREILQLIAEGSTTRAIAEKLHLSVKTVETHRMILMKRLDIHNIADLVRYAVREGVVKLNQ